MTPFSFALTLLSFIYALALTHLLMGAARMIRHRRELTFSWPHALWMVLVFMQLVVNWLTFWDAHSLNVIDLGSYALFVAAGTSNYLAAALVTPEFERTEDYDLKRFHAEQGRTYLAALLAFAAIAFLVNAAGAMKGFGAWAEQNGFVAALAGCILAALVWPKNRFVQVAAPLATIPLIVWFAILFYPRIA